MKMRQSLAELELQFANEASLERHRRAWLQHSATKRRLARETNRRRKRGSLRFALLVTTLIATALVVTVAMFATLYLLLD
jgi:cell division septal protein FtsQ